MFKSVFPGELVQGIGFCRCGCSCPCNMASWVFDETFSQVGNYSGDDIEH